MRGFPISVCPLTSGPTCTVWSAIYLLLHAAALLPYSPSHMTMSPSDCYPPGSDANLMLIRSFFDKILPSQIRLLISHCHTLAVLNWCPLSRRVILQKRSSRDSWHQPSNKPGLSHARCSRVSDSPSDITLSPVAVLNWCSLSRRVILQKRSSRDNWRQPSNNAGLLHARFSRVSDSPSDITLSHVGSAELVSAQPACHLTKAIITRQLIPTIQQRRPSSCKILTCLRFAF